jgi:hypothetical protein
VYGSCVCCMCDFIVDYTLHTVQRTPDNKVYKHPIHGTETDQCTLTVDSHSTHLTVLDVWSNGVKCSTVTTSTAYDRTLQYKTLMFTTVQYFTT